MNDNHVSPLRSEGYEGQNLHTPSLLHGLDKKSLPLRSEEKEV
jgi:hypothetical protein